MRAMMLGLALAAVATFGLVGCAQPATTPAKVELKVPWTDGESTSYVIQDQQGKQIGMANLTAAKSGDAYDLKQVYDIAGSKDDISLKARASDLKPISGHRIITSAQGTITIDTTYKDGKLNIQAQTKDGPKSADIDVPTDAYDNDEALFFWRALPYADGYKFTYTNVVAANALKPVVSLTVQGKEKVSSPAGQIDSWKVLMEAGQQKQYLWFELATPNRLVKYDNGATVFLLNNK